MKITIEYQATAQELAKASSLFIEKKPFLFVLITILNFVTGIFLLIFTAKLFVLGLTWQEWISSVAFALWLFGRKSFNEKLLLWRMKSSPVLGKTVVIEISRNGIVWSGKGLRTDHIAWNTIKYIIETQNGFIFPNTIAKFLWLPFRGFKSPQDLQDFRDLITELKIKHKLYPKWKC